MSETARIPIYHRGIPGACGGVAFYLTHPVKPTDMPREGDFESVDGETLALSDPVVCGSCRERVLGFGAMPALLWASGVFDERGAVG